MPYLLLDTYADWQGLLPLTYFHPIGRVRAGAVRWQQAWQQALNEPPVWVARDYLRTLYPADFTPGTWTVVRSSALPTETLVQALRALPEGARLTDPEGRTVAVHTYLEHLPDDLDRLPFQETRHISDITYLARPWKWIQHLPALLLQWLPEGPWQQVRPQSVFLQGDALFVHPDAEIEPCFIDTRKGPGYVDAHAHIMQGAMIQGPAYIGPHSQVKMGAKIYGPVALGEWVKVGGEVSHTIIQAYSNKAHDGFLGHAYIGEWVNIGADTNNSNLKNTYGPVKMWDYTQQRFVNTGMQFLGLVMGDHAKAGINTMFNTGTVVGVSANVFGAGFPRTFIPSFAWGGASGFSTYQVDRALDAARRMMARRQVNLTPEYEQVFRHVFELSSPERWWEKRK